MGTFDNLFRKAPYPSSMKPEVDKLLDEHAAVWRSYWQESWGEFPEERVHNTWMRNNYYSTESFSISFAVNSMVPLFGLPIKVYCCSPSAALPIPF